MVGFTTLTINKADPSEDPELIGLVAVEVIAGWEELARLAPGSFDRDEALSEWEHGVLQGFDELEKDYLGGKLTPNAQAAWDAIAVALVQHGAAANAVGAFLPDWLKAKRDEAAARLLQAA